MNMANPPGQCDDSSNNEMKALAIQRHGSGAICYGPVNIFVLGTSVAGGVTFINFNAPNTSGQSGTYRARWGVEADMWVCCPSSLPSSAQSPDLPGTPPPERTTGLLYLSKSFINAQVPPIRPVETPKWPDCLPLLTIGGGKMKIWPISLILTGRELMDDEATERSVDLLDPHYVLPEQTINLKDQVLEIDMTAPGFKKFEVHPDAFEELADAVQIIKNQDPDFWQRARAWNIVATCSSSIEAEYKASKTINKSEALRLIQELEPAWGAEMIE
jgi:hypothetical protein